MAGMTWFRRSLLPLVLVALLAGLVAWPTAGADVANVVWAIATAIVAVDLVMVTIDRLRHGRIAVDLVALIALAGALLLGEYLAGVILALMVASGDALEQFAHRRAERSLSALLSLAPRIAHRHVDGRLDDVAVDRVQAGDLLLVKPGEVVPTDGTVLSPAVVDESVLTGESRPVERGVGEPVRSGSVNAGGAVTVRATATAADSAYAGIVALVRNAGVERAPFVRLADRYAMWFVPVVLGLTGLTWLATGDSVRALAVLVVATPCPLVLAAPVAIVSGVASAARVGVVVKDGGALESLGQARTVLFDKTGTLTSGRAHVVAVAVAPGLDATEVLRLAASVEQASPHVLATALVHEALERGLDLETPDQVDETAGSGVSGTVGGRRIWVGTMPEADAPTSSTWIGAARRRARRESCSTIAVVVDGKTIGIVLFTDDIRTDAPRALRSLRRAGVDRIVMVTGDHLEVAEPVGASIGIDQVYADRSPAEKLEVVHREVEGRPGTTVMVGDGVNDAPALAAADLGVAMGARGATASSEAADVVLIVDRLDRLSLGVGIARRSRSIARQSVLVGMGLSFLAMVLAAVGLLAPIGGAVVQEVIDVVAIANALRAVRPPAAARVERRVPDEWSDQLARGHGPLRLVIEEIRSVADALDTADPVEAQRSLIELSRRVEDEVVSHERIDEAEVYPDVAEALGGDDPLGPMSRSHQEIFHLSSVLQRLVDQSDGSGLDAADRAEARRILYALDAILRLHFAQEEELLMSMTSHEGSTP